ncbi:hypothetical protein L484_019197 [Morus notabilis]|uniref:Uncharacterized protein n=1 Tax=Morus notabilis TaxID=981085 RepID=W9R1B3_9ROSA|nr:hypothetical protein L484_019197 [Morus notabilis]
MSVDERWGSRGVMRSHPFELKFEWEFRTALLAFAIYKVLELAAIELKLTIPPNINIIVNYGYSSVSSPTRIRHGPVSTLMGVLT